MKTPIILALEGVRHEDFKFKASLGYVMNRPCLKIPNKHKKVAYIYISPEIDYNVRILSFAL